jgi:diaminobutyrate-2-oxoglutarate transaminase
MAAGAATLRFVAAEKLPARATQLGSRIRERLNVLRATLPAIGDVRGQGLMLGVELVDSTGQPDIRGALPAAPELAVRMRAACLERGLIVELGGRHNSVVRLLPPLTITDEQVESVLDRLVDAISKESR